MGGSQVSRRWDGRLSQSMAQVWLIHFQRRFSPFSSLSRNVIREVCSYLSAPEVLPALLNDTLTLHTFDSSPVVSVHLPVVYPAGGVCCVQFDQEVVCLGSDPPTSQVYGVHVTTLTCTLKPSMLRPRAWPGVIVVTDIIYVFGGDLNSCEKFTGEQWKSLPDMIYPKCDFNPVCYKEEIFLCTFGVDIETFDRYKEVFSRLPVRLPGTHVTACTCFRLGSKMLILGKTTAVSWEIHSTEIDTWQLQKAVWGCVGGPRRCKGQVYWTDFTGQVVSYDIDHRRVK